MRDCECVGKRRRSHGRHSTVERDSMSSNATFVNLLLVAAPAEKRLSECFNFIPTVRTATILLKSKKAADLGLVVLIADVCGHRNRTLPPVHHCTISLLLTDCRGRGEPGRSACRLPWPRPLMHARQTANLHRVRVLELVRTQDTHASATGHGKRQVAPASRLSIDAPPSARRVASPNYTSLKSELNQLSYCSSSDGLDLGVARKTPMHVWCLNVSSSFPHGTAPPRRCWDLRIRHPNSIARIQKLQILSSPILRSSTGLRGIQSNSTP